MDVILLGKNQTYHSFFQHKLHNLRSTTEYINHILHFLFQLYLNNNNLIDIPSVLLDWSSLHIFEFNGNPFLCSCNLHNISRSLDKRITRLKAGPYCIGGEENSFQVFALDDRVCKGDVSIFVWIYRVLQKKWTD